MNQKSGDNSQLIQAQTVNNYFGISEDRARQIFQEEAKKITVYTREAASTAFERISRLENDFMQNAIKVDGALEAFSDPAFQLLLREAAEKAAATEREEDYALLSQLLICHIQKGNERKKRAGIHRAIKIVDEIDNEALCALTNAFAISNYTPLLGKCRDGLRVLDDLFSKLMYMDLPSGNQWLDHLDVLGAIRISSFGHLKPLQDYYSEKLNGYACIGIQKETQQYNEAKELLSKCRECEYLLVDNECLEGYVRLDLPNKKYVDNIILSYPPTINNAVSQLPRPNDLKDVLHKILSLYSNDIDLMTKVKQNFEKMIEEYVYLFKIKQWWNNIPNSFEITSVGKVLAFTNARRCDSTLPELKL